MGVAGLTINIITLGALAVAVGRVVDDAIVVLENIYRHRARGEAIGDGGPVSGTREVAARHHEQHPDDGRGVPAPRASWAAS